MAIRFTFKRPDRDRRVTELSVTYGGYCGRRILFNGSTIRFRNVASPLIVHEKFPKGFFDERVRVLNPAEARKLSKALCRVDMTSWKSDAHLSYLNDSMIHTGFRCRFSDGWEFRYESAEQPPESFKKMVSMLTAYCDDRAAVAGERRETQIKGRACLRCGESIPAEAKFCPCCGEKQSPAEPGERLSLTVDMDETLALCAKCGKPMRVSWRYCAECGEKGI